MDNNTQLHDVMERLEKTGRQQVLYARLQFCFSAATLALCLILVVLILVAIPRAQALLADLQAVTTQLAQMDLGAMIANVDSLVVHVDSLVSNADALVASSQTGVEEALKAIEAIDFETLNKAIEDFSAVVEPLAKFFNIF